MHPTWKRTSSQCAICIPWDWQSPGNHLAEELQDQVPLASGPQPGQKIVGQGSGVDRAQAIVDGNIEWRCEVGWLCHQYWSSAEEWSLQPPRVGNGSRSRSIQSEKLHRGGGYVFLAHMAAVWKPCCWDQPPLCIWAKRLVPQNPFHCSTASSFPWKTNDRQSCNQYASISGKHVGHHSQSEQREDITWHRHLRWACNREEDPLGSNIKHVSWHLLRARAPNIAQVYQRGWLRRAVSTTGQHGAKWTSALCRGENCLTLSLFRYLLPFWGLTSIFRQLLALLAFWAKIIGFILLVLSLSLEIASAKLEENTHS